MRIKLSSTLRYVIQLNYDDQNLKDDYFIFVEGENRGQPYHSLHNVDLVCD
jgi:hypothetical protein